MAFEGFSAAALAFLTTLGQRDKAWFDANRATYQAEVVVPTKAFVAELGERLAEEISRAIVAQPKTNGSIAPINNDLRFAPNQPPYKDHLLIKFWEGENKKRAPTLWVRISGSDVGFATGSALPDLKRWRALIDDNTTGAELADALELLGKGRDLHVAGEGYKRVPKPYDGEHPRANLLRHKVFQARWSEPSPTAINGPGFLDFCMDRLTACAPVHTWLVAHL
ncbi:MAG: DUF2461 domain-containing protein [Acidimicrobiales bacterium]|nr:DUF2461 domain-containing protein [Acidimicrobiales bacterium]